MGAANESAEDYLETILLLGKRLPVVRAVDIATEMNFKKSSVSVAMKNLRERDLITVSEQGYIFLTEEGKRLAETVYEKHEWFTHWLISLGVKETTAASEACKIEHVISPETFEAIKRKHGNLPK